MREQVLDHTKHLNNINFTEFIFVIFIWLGNYLRVWEFVPNTMKINIYLEIHICRAAWVLICDYKAEIKTKQAKNHTHNQKGSILHALGTAPDVQNSKFSVYAVEQITQMSMTWWHFILYQGSTSEVEPSFTHHLTI